MRAPGSSGFQGGAVYPPPLCAMGVSPPLCAMGVSPPGANSVVLGGAVVPPFSSMLYLVDSGGLPSPVYYPSISSTGSPGGAATPASSFGGVGFGASPPAPPPQQQQQQQQDFHRGRGDEQAVPCMPVMITTPGSPSPLLASSGFHTCTDTANVLGERNMNPVLTGVVAQSIQGAAITGFPHLSQSPPFTQQFLTNPMMHGVSSVVSGPSVKNVAILASNGQIMDERKVNQNTGEVLVEVYSPDFTSLISLPASSIVHQPPPESVSRLVLCRKYVSGRVNSCRKGNTCRFVHADASGAPRSPIHVNYAWQCVERCTYQRLPPGEVLTVLEPNEREPSENIPSERILITQGSLSYKTHFGPVSHCAHYYFNRLCKLGENCNFIHALHVDPTVTVDFKRAPAPASVVSAQKRNSSSKKTTSDEEITAKPNIVGSCNEISNTDESATAPASVSFAFSPDVPKNSIDSVSQLGGGSVCSRSTRSGPPRVMESPLTEDLNYSAWQEGNTTTMT